MIESLDGPPPTLRQLGYLVELSERLNFRIAAEAQLVTQSTLSAGIKELESVLGVQLVERDKRHVRLTAVGEEVVARARALLAAATDLAEAARSAALRSRDRCGWAPSPRSRLTCCRACSRRCGALTRT
jgi:LysR family hydrogen peroxide-inducible transcriptional activator